MIDAAITLIASGGAEGFTLREAARQVGVDHRAAYHHFDDKTALLAAVAEEGFRELAARTKRAYATRTRTPMERLRTMVTGYIRFALEHPAHYRVMFAGPPLHESARFPSLDAAAMEGFRLLVSGIEEAVGDDPETAYQRALAIWTMQHGYCDLLFTRRIKPRPIAAAQEFFVRLMRLMEELPRSRTRL
jgi:AcrR family transcriptional regulator